MSLKHSFSYSDIVKTMLSKQCALLDSGYNPKKMNFYYCSCDLEKKEPMCQECIEGCHSDHNTNIPLVPCFIEQICHCGLNYHRTNSQNTDTTSPSSCYFSEWSIISKTFIYYSYGKSHICMFCKNFCENYQNTKTNNNPTLFKRKILSRDKSYPKCDCTDDNHKNSKLLIEALNKLSNYQQYDFHDLSLLHIINMLFVSEQTFKYLYSNFITEKNNFKEEIATLNLKFTPQIVNNSDFSTRLKNMYILSQKINNMYYFSDSFFQIYDSEFAETFLKYSLDSSNTRVWNLKKCYISGYLKMILNKEFVSFPQFNVYDIMNMNPLKRLLINNNVFKDTNVYTKYLNKKSKKFYIKSLFNMIEILLNYPEKNLHILEILKNIFTILYTFAKFYLLEDEEIIRFSVLNEKLIQTLASTRRTLFRSKKENKLNLLSDFLENEVNIMLPIVKSLIFIVYYLNDSIVISFIRTGENIDNIKFFHGNHSIALQIQKNCVSLMNFLKINYENEYSNFSRIHKNDPSIKDFKKMKISRKMRKLIYYNLELTSLISNNIDHYLNGLRKLLDQNKEIYLKFIDDTLTPTELSYVNFLNEKKNSIEKNYMEYYNLALSFDDLKNQIIKTINDVFTFIGVTQKIPIDNDSIVDEEDKIDDSYLVLQSKSGTIKIYKKNQLQNNSPYQLLLNKSYFIFTLVKFLKIQNDLNNLKKKNEIGTLIEDNSIIDEILKFLYFYTNNNPDNCTIILSSKIFFMLEEMNFKILAKFIDFYISCFKILKNFNYILSSFQPQLKFLRNMVKRFKIEDHDMLIYNKIVKFIFCLIQLPSIGRDFHSKRMRKIIFGIYNSGKYIKDYKTQLVGNKSTSFINFTGFFDKEEQVPTYQLKNTISNHCKENGNDKYMLVDSLDESDIKMLNKDDQKITNQMIELINYDGNNIVNDKEIEIKNISRSNTEINIKEDKKILHKLLFRFLRILNYCFELDNEDDSLQVQDILKPLEIQKILKKKDLNIFIRIEILKFFQTHYIKPLVDIKEIKSYMSVFANPIKDLKTKNIIDDTASFKIMEDFLSINTLVFSLKLNHSVIINEMKYFTEVLNKNKSIKQETLMKYLEEGILIPFYVYFDKLMNFFSQQTGFDYIKLYELTIYFLKLKKFIFERKNYFTKQNPKEKGNFFQESVNFNNKLGYLLFTADYSEEELKKLDKDSETISKPDFPVLNNEMVYQILKSNVSFIKTPRSKSLVEVFEKKKVIYDEEKIEKIRERLKKANYLQNSFEEKIFEIIISYENIKQTLDSCSFISNMNDINEAYFKKFRLLFVSFCFYFLDNKLKTRYMKQNLWNLLRFLQYDTTEIQKDAISLNEANQINFKYTMEMFCYNLVGIFYNYSNPSVTIQNQNYFDAINMIKIFKYLCEEHNQYFQAIFFKELKFEYYIMDNYEMNKERTDHIGTFSIMLRILEKIFTISKWETINFTSIDDDFSYFYDIFFVIIEFLVEMIQGTSLENLKSFEEKADYENLSIFLTRMKSVLMNNQHNSKVLYNIHKEIGKLISAFIEERNTPIRVIHLISLIISPSIILDIIISTMKKLYLRLNNNNFEDYDKFILNNTCCDFFLDNFYNNKTFTNDPEFELSIILFNYVKLLDCIHNNLEAKEYISSILELKGKYIALDNSEYKDNSNNTVYLEKHFYQSYFVLDFFEKITRTVEIQMEDGLIQKVNFTINPLTAFLTEYTKKNFLENVNRESRFTKILSLIESTEYFFDEIIYYERSPLIRKFSNINYHNVEIFLFALTIILNLIIFSTIEEHSTSAISSNTTTTNSTTTNTSHGMLDRMNLRMLSGSSSSSTSTGHDNSSLILISKIICGIQGFVCIVTLITWIFAKLPLYFKIEVKKYSQIYGIELEKIGFLQRVYIIIYKSMIEKNEINSMVLYLIFVLIALDSDSQDFFSNSLQLLLIINLSRTLKNIMQSVTYRWRQLLTTSFFIIISIYIFSMIAFFYIRDHYKKLPDRICSSLFYCFITHLNLGLRTDGGIGEAIEEADFLHEKGLYIGNFFFILLFFIIIIVVLMAIVFGIVIDTFSELKDQTHKIEHDKAKVCYICGESKSELEKKGTNFYFHVEYNHNTWDYINYMIALKFVDPQETNATNSYAIEMINKKSISWVPSGKKD